MRAMKLILIFYLKIYKINICVSYIQMNATPQRVLLWICPYRVLFIVHLIYVIWYKSIIYQQSTIETDPEQLSFNGYCGSHKTLSL
jgi:hypothetical protein